MSLVGKELEVSFAGTAETEIDEEISCTEDAHKPLSPASGAEVLFMSGLRTSTISANALASELRKNYHSFRSNSTAAATDDFHSTCDNIDDLLLKQQDGNGSAALTQKPIYELEEDPKNMSTAAEKVNVDEINVDAATHVYEGVKNVWGWGKNQVVISTFLGIAEGIAGKVVSVAGTDLEEIDGNIKPQLSTFDSGILNPAIKRILGIVLNVAGKGEGMFKPIIVSILKPIGLIKESKESVAPELTNTRTAMVN